MVLNRCVLGFIGAVLGYTTPVVAEPVDVVQGNSNGSGYTFRRGDACFVITAGHVVPELGIDIAVADRTGAKAVAKRIYHNPSPIEDLALLELPARSIVACNDRWPAPDEIAPSRPGPNALFEVIRHYAGGRETIVRLRGAGGTTQWLTLAFEDKLRIIQSDSGSIVRSQGRYAGIVVSVRDAEDRVDVLRFDVIDRLVGERFRTVVRGVPVQLDGVSNKGRVHADWTTYLASWLTDTAGRPVVGSSDASARCRIQVQVIDWSRSRVDNPEHARMKEGLQRCGEGTKLPFPIPIQLGTSSKDRASCQRAVREQMKGVPASVTSHKLTLNVQMTPRGGSTVSKLQTTEYVEDGEKGTSRAEVELNALQQSFAQVAGEMFKDAACP